MHEKKLFEKQADMPKQKEGIELLYEIIASQQKTISDQQKTISDQQTTIGLLVNKLWINIKTLFINKFIKLKNIDYITLLFKMYNNK